jgi:hypothetical protein
MNNAEMLMTGFLGGCIGSLLMMWSLQTYYKHTIREFLDAQYKLKKEYDIKLITEEVKNLRMQVAALQSQFGVNETDY